MRTARVTLVAAALALVLVAPISAGSATLVSGTYGVTDFGTLTCVPLGAAGFVVRCSTSGFVSSYSGSLTGTTTTNLPR